MNPETAATCTLDNFNEVVFAVCMHVYDLNMMPKIILIFLITDYLPLFCVPRDSPGNLTPSAATCVQQVTWH